jgi:signal transduction histidine kinase/DNA-binding response OmpR family regulator
MLQVLVEQTLARVGEVVTAEVNLAHRKIGKAAGTAIVKHHSSSSLPYSDAPDQNLLGSVIVIRDISDEKKIDQMKTDFISTVSHELRTPLTSVLGFAKLIDKRLEDTIFPTILAAGRQQQISPPVQKAVQQISDNLKIILLEGERLTNLINDVLDIAKMEAGSLEWQMRPLDVNELVTQAISRMTPLFQDKGIRLISNLPKSLPKILGDHDRLLQVLINLLSNSLKFTEQGSVTCQAEQIEDEIMIRVIDTGIGISTGDQAKVFEKFKQAGNILTDRPAGTGLGLPICKQIVEYHGGRILLESQLGCGSTFSFSIPIAAGSSPQTSLDLDDLVRQLKEHVVATTCCPGGNRKTILVVDDELNVRELLKQELETEGYHVLEAANGLDAITQVKQQKPDLIILDVMMPEMSGFDAAAVLKNDPETAAIPIIILSILEDQERGYRLGVDRYLTKPFDMEHLLQEISILIAEGHSNKKVLIIDENLSTVRTLTQALQARGYQVSEADSRTDGMHKALSIRPDMIIVNTLLSEHHHLVKTLRFEKGLENVFFVLLAENTTQINHES